MMENQGEFVTRPTVKEWLNKVLETERKLYKEFWNIKKEQRTQYAKTWIKSIGFPTPFEFSKLHLIVEAKLTMLIYF